LGTNETEGMITHTGSIIDATFVDVPKQRNTREENKTIKEGNISENWKEDAENQRFQVKEGEMPLSDREKQNGGIEPSVRNWLKKIPVP
jgi:hypothetical protein